ncbi:unnamed protein product [Durusdinium trenchii]|uniref:Uncharacterized protein n=1 Tax=Durusdinium trenchii TaxID=1381693 RepID=A0ABP0PHG9_9DINO
MRQKLCQALANVLNLDDLDEQVQFTCVLWWKQHETIHVSLARARTALESFCLGIQVELRRGAMNPENWQVKSVPAHEGGIASLDWSPSSSPAVLATGPAVARAHGRWLGARRLATCGADGQLIIWRIDAKNDSFHREHVLDGDQIGGNDLWCSLSWRPNVGLPGNSLGAVSKEGEVMILSQDAEGMAFAPRQRWSLAQGAGCRLTWTKAGTLLAILVSPEKCVLFKESSSGEWKEIAAVDGS